MSLLRRASQGQPASQGTPQGQNQNQGQAPTPAQQPGNAPQTQQPNNGRFGPGRFGNGNNTQPQNQPNPNNNRPFGSSQPGSVPMASWSVTPLHTNVVRFSLDGLGDPFYRLLGHPLNADYGKTDVLAKALEAGGEAVSNLAGSLQTAWEGYGLDGAALVYPHAMASWDVISNPAPMPGVPDWLAQTMDDEQGHAKTESNATHFKLYRALDLALVLNVLARSRSQVLLASSPLVMSQQYIRRTLLSDDPRLVRIALATGCVENVLVAVNRI